MTVLYLFCRGCEAFTLPEGGEQCDAGHLADGVYVRAWEADSDR